MRLLVFGATGQVAGEIARMVPGATFLGRDRCDLGDPPACGAAVEASDADAVINAAAYTAVDRAESEPDLAFTINAEAPAAMARAAASKGIPFLHISSDYVFDGSGSRPWRPDDPVAPLGVYGRSKAAGEASVRAAGGPHAILRTSWVFAATGTNFVKTMLRLSRTRDRLTVVSDQIGGPTPATAIAAALVDIAGQLAADPARTGTYHLSGSPDVSWADFAREIMGQAGLATEIADITTADYPTPARRPANSRLDCTSLRETFGIDRPDWRAELGRIVEELEASP